MCPRRLTLHPAATFTLDAPFSLMKNRDPYYPKNAPANILKKLAIAIPLYPATIARPILRLQNKDINQNISYNSLY